MISQIITALESFSLDVQYLGFCASPFFLQTMGPWFPKRTVDHSACYFLPSWGVMCFWCSLRFHSGVFFLKTSVCGGSLCTDTSLSPLLVMLSHVLKINFSSQSFQGQNQLFSYHTFPLQWTFRQPAIFSSDLPWLLLVEGVDDQDNCQVALFPVIVILCPELGQGTHCGYSVWIITHSKVWKTFYNI